MTFIIPANLLFGSLAIPVRKTWLRTHDFASPGFPGFAFRSAGRSWSTTYIDFRRLALRRRLLTVLLLSAVWRSWPGY